METLAELHKTINKGIDRDNLKGSKQAIYMGTVSHLMWAVQNDCIDSDEIQTMIQRCELGITILDIMNDDSVDAEFMRKFLRGKVDYKILE